MEQKKSNLNSVFLSNIFNIRNRKKINVKDFAELTGLSASYYYNIERTLHASDKTNDLKKNISLSNLHKIILALSLRKTPSIGDLENGVYSEDDLDLELLKKLMFSALFFEDFEDSFLIRQKINSTENLIHHFIHQNKLNETPIELIHHEYEIWTFSDVISESNYKSNAQETAINIIKYKMKYVFITSISDNIEWIKAYLNIENEVLKLLNENKNLKVYWDKNSWHDYLQFIGISDYFFLCRMRLYNPINNVEGNYNVGGASIESVELVNMTKERATEIKNNLKTIISEVEVFCYKANTLYHIPEKGYSAMKKKYIKS